MITKGVAMTCPDPLPQATLDNSNMFTCCCERKTLLLSLSGTVGHEVKEPCDCGATHKITRVKAAGSAGDVDIHHLQTKFVALIDDDDPIVVKK